MVNRKENQLEEFKELITREWQLNLDEEEFLDSVLNLLLSRETKKASEIVNFFYSEEWENLLELIPKYPIKNYAEFHYDMVEKSDIIEKKLCEFDYDEIISYLEDKGYSVDDEFFHREDYDYVDSCLFEDIVSVFDSLDVFSRQKLRDLVIQFR